MKDSSKNSGLMSAGPQPQEQLLQAELSGGTGIDLGEDLLQEATRSLTQQPASPFSSSALSPGQPQQPADQEPQSLAEFLAQARIMLNEGFLEDAKQTLRKALIVEPAWDEARRFLEDIQATELKKLLRESREPAVGGGSGGGDEGSQALQSRVLEQIDQDLGLGLALDDAHPSSQWLSDWWFDFEQYLTRQSPGRVPVQLWIDCAVNLMMMEAYALATRVLLRAQSELKARQMASLGFEGVAGSRGGGGSEERGGEERAVAGETGAGPFQPERQDWLSVHCLLADSLMKCGRHFEALEHLQPLLYDDLCVAVGAAEPSATLSSSSASSGKRSPSPPQGASSCLELFYLAGGLYHALGQKAFAYRYYRQAQRLQPDYRDLKREMSRLLAVGGL